LFELNFATLLLATTYALPGFLFISLILRYCFPTGGIGARRSIILLAALICSTGLIALLQWGPVNLVAQWIAQKSWIQIFFSKDYRDFLQGKVSFTKILDAFSDLGTKENSNHLTTASSFTANLSLILIAIVTPIGALAGIAAILSIKLVQALTRIHWNTWVGNIYTVFNLVLFLTSNFIHFVTRVLALLFGVEKIRRFRKWADYPIKILKNILYSVAIIPVLFLFLVLLAFTLVNIILEIVLWLFDKIFFLFRHPWEAVFYRFGLRENHVIVEIRVGETILYKGVYVGFEPLNEVEVDSITITNVLQYTKKSPAGTFELNNRNAYIFEHAGGRLTISKAEISDFHVWHFKISEFDLGASITNEASMWNKVWYLRLVLAKNRAFFDSNSLRFKLDVEVMFLFSRELLTLLLEYYSHWIYRPKFRKEFYRYMKGLRRDLSWFRQNKNTLAPPTVAKLQQEKEELLHLVSSTRKKYFPPSRNRVLAR